MKNKYLLIIICTIVFFAILAANTVNAVTIEPNPELQATCGIDIALVLDSSGSISSSDMVVMKNAFIGFVNILLPNTPTQFSVIDFDDNAVILQSFTNNKTDIINAINMPTSGGCTNWEDGLIKANDTFDPRVDKPDLVLFASDGNPNTVYGGSPCGTSESAAVSAAVAIANTMKLDGIRIITLGIGDDIDSANLIAISSSDAYYDVDEFDELEDTLETIASELCGGTISVQKKVDGEPEAGWEFTLTVTNGTATPNPGITDDLGFVVFDINITQGSEAIVNITETLKTGYLFDSVYAQNCTGAIVGTPGTNAIYGIPVRGDCAIYCLFNNTNLTGLDDTPPVTNKTVSDPKYGPNDEWVTESTEFNLTAFDNESGVNATYYRIWYMGSWSLWEVYDGNFTLDGNCMHYIEFYSVDNAGNIEPVQNQTHYVDEMAPITNPYPPEFGIPYTTIEYEGEQYVVINCTTPMWINVTDPSCGIGVLNISYSVWYYDTSSSSYVKIPGSEREVHDNDIYDLDPDLGEISVSLTIDEECLHQVRWTVFDLFGHFAIYNYSFAVDCTPPTITKTHPICYIPIDPDTGWIGVCNEITLSAIDGGTFPCISGVDDIFWGFTYEGTWHPIDPFDSYGGNTVGYFKDDKWWYTYSPSLNVHWLETGLHVLEYWAKDKVNNMGPTHTQTYWANICQPEIWVDDDYTSSTPGWRITHFNSIRYGLEWLESGGTAHIHKGIYLEDIVVDDVPCCDNTGITIEGVECYPSLPKQSGAVIVGTITIKVNDVSINCLMFEPTSDPAITVEGSGAVIQHNIFFKECLADATAIENMGQSMVEARYNYWGAPNGPSGGVIDPVTGMEADGYGTILLGDNIRFDPWAGVHAQIKASKTEVEPGQSIVFSSEPYSFAYYIDGTPNDYHVLWDFGDGEYSQDKTIGHVFDMPGTYQVSLRIRAGDTSLHPGFMYDWDYVTIHVLEPGAPLTVSADGPGLSGYETLVGDPVQLFGQAYGGDGVYTWSWDFGDDSAGSSIQNPTHAYDAPGTYTATLTVTSGSETASDTAEVVVYDVEELLVNVGHDLDTIVGIDNLFTVSVKGGRAPYSYLWNFGDGATSTVANPVHVFTSPGEYVVEVTLTDSLGKSKSDKSMVSVVEDTTIEQCEILSVSGGFGVKVSISSGDEPVDWSIDVDGGIVLLGGHNSGNIPKKSEQAVQIPLTIGFGKVDITVTVNDLVEKRSAFLLGPFFLGVREI